MRFGCASVILASATIAAAEPPPRVVVLDTSAEISSPGLAAQLRLHVRAAIAIEPPPAEPGEDLASRLDRAAAIVDRGAATVAVWIEPLQPTSSRRFVAYAVGRWPDRAIIELVRIDATTPRDQVERIVALKVAALLDRVMLPGGKLAGVDTGHTPPARGPPVTRIHLGASIATDHGRDTVGGAVAGATHVVFRGPIQLAPELQLRWFSTSIVGDRRVAIGDVSLLAGAVACAGDRLAGCASLRAGAAFISADAATADGRRGGRTEVVPVAAIAASARLPLTAPIGVAVELAAERGLVEQRFLVDGMVAVDLSGWRVVASATLVLAL
jgi:hypothetical protein